MCSSKKSSTREEGRANAGSRPDAVATNSDDGDGSGDAFPVIFFAAGLILVCGANFRDAGRGADQTVYPLETNSRLPWASGLGTLRLQACAFLPLEASEPSGTAIRPGSPAAPPPAPLCPARVRDGALRAATRDPTDARAPPLVHRARASPAPRRPLHRRATRRTGRPVRPPGHDGRVLRLRAVARGRRVLRRAQRAQRRAMLLSRALPHPPPTTTECARPRPRQRSQKVWGEHARWRPVSVRRTSGA